MIKVRNYRKRNGTFVNSYLRRNNPKHSIRKVITFTKNVYEVYSKIKDTYNFTHGSREDRYKTIVDQALKMYFPQAQAIQIANEILSKIN